MAGWGLLGQRDPRQEGLPRLPAHPLLCGTNKTPAWGTAISRQPAAGARQGPLFCSPGKVLLPAVGTAGTSCCAALCTASAATRPSRGCTLERKGSAQWCGWESILLPGQPGQPCGPLLPLAPELAREGPCPAAGLSSCDIRVLWGAGAQPAGCGCTAQPLPAACLPAGAWPHAGHPPGPMQGTPITLYRSSPRPHTDYPHGPCRASL